MDAKEWEALCKRCGKCCYEKVDLGAGVIHYTDIPCEHLDTETKLCKVYRKRHDAEADCMKLTENLVRTTPWMPDDCAYVEYLRLKDTMAEVRAVRKRKSRRTRSRRKHNGRQDY